MPSKSERQHNLMEAAAHDPEFAREHHIPQSVAREYVSADESIAAHARKHHPHDGHDGKQGDQHLRSKHGGG